MDPGVIREAQGQERVVGGFPEEGFLRVGPEGCGEGGVRKRERRLEFGVG